MDVALCDQHFRNRLSEVPLISIDHQESLIKSFMNRKHLQQK